MIACPITDNVRKMYKKDFKLLSLPTNCSSGYIYLRGSNPVGVAMTRSYEGDADRWICRPEVSDSVITETGLSRNDVLRRMISDSCYGSECRGTAIKLTSDNDELYPILNDIDHFDFTPSPDGGIIGKTTADTSWEEDNGLPEECASSINGMWSLDAIDPHPIKTIISCIEQMLVSKKDQILSLYNYAEKKGKYLPVSSLLRMSTILDIYVEYFNDLTQFICAKLDNGPNTGSDASVAAIKALDIDDNFISKLFEDENKLGKGTFSEATLEILEAFIGFSSFLYEISDSFITIQGKCGSMKPSANDLALINVYGYSITRFLKRYYQELVGVQYPALVRIMTTGAMELPQKTVPIDQKYVLL